MKSITREWLQKTIAEFETTCDEITFGMDEDDAKILQVLKLKLASMDADTSVAGIVEYGTSSSLPEEFVYTFRSSRLIALGEPVYTVPPATDDQQVAELTMWVKRLASSLRNTKPDSQLPYAAIAYLSRKGLISVADVLR